ncbi:MAG: hypothetical protein WKF96_01565 [Solirubrobacteraceae bacterium]
MLYESLKRRRVERQKPDYCFGVTPQCPLIEVGRLRVRKQPQTPEFGTRALDQPGVDGQQVLAVLRARLEVG